jgi:hypothetical protein
MKKLIMKKLILFFSILVCLYCKKKNSTSVSTPQSGGNTNNTIVYGLPPNINQLNGFFLSRKTHHITYNYLLYYVNVGMSIIPKSILAFNPYLYIISGYDYADTIIINNIRLKYDSNFKIYTDTTASSFTSPYTISLKGNSNFQGFSTTIRPVPSINSTSFIPLQFSKSQPLTLNWGSGNFSQTDSIIVTIVDNSSGQYISKSLSGNNISCTFYPSDLSFLNPASPITQMHIYLKNYCYLSTGSKMYVFCNYLNEIANITVTN